MIILKRLVQVLISITIGLVLLSGCSWLYEIGSEPEAKNGNDLSAAEMEIIPFEAVNQHGDTVTDKDLEGDYWMANMIFTRCPTVCNLMTPNMLNLQGKLQEEGLDVRLVSFTVDPEFDGPEQLKKYGDDYGADYSSWDFLTGYTQEEIKEIGKESFKSVVEKDPENEDIIHATTFFLINPEGQVIRSYDGLENDPEPIVNDLKQLME
ncbi:SCO family protein [Alteribacillus iranensis]|uniref:Protein SCO1/2 n=1 Tax=Alteribacillus iranensis TaxID=930128 RepID=A0A1I2CYN0_9BACI|nr:SCO family protein [Alteribacillus iranensis]SFE72840.1 protein SCO1/2 [Alteribacillus iranensis]